jgi:hypothetical protein
VLDIDDTDDAVHGQQELALFNAHVGSYCFQPIKIFEAGSGKPVAVLMRPGKRPAGEETAKILRHVVRRIRKHWPKVATLVRGDSHYCSEEAMALLEMMRCDYILGFAINSKLAEIAPGASSVCCAWGREAARCAASISSPTGQGAGAARARSSLASRPPTWARMPASSSPTSKAEARSSTRRSTAHAGAPRT